MSPNVGLSPWVGYSDRRGDEWVGELLFDAGAFGDRVLVFKSNWDAMANLQPLSFLLVAIPG
jgi:hypothetical protein